MWFKQLELTHYEDVWVLNAVAAVDKAKAEAYIESRKPENEKFQAMLHSVALVL